MYSNPRSRIILNDHETDYFGCPIGVKQGDCLSPTLFAIFINDLALEIKESNIGINLDDHLFLNILMYADDIVLLAENEADLQSLLLIVEKWCKEWRLEVNLTKTNILHVRNKRKLQSKFVFLFNNRPVIYCKYYTYLGVSINEHLDFGFTAQVQADTAGRALSSIVTKMIKNGGFPYNVYSILYETCITSISDYGGEVIGFSQHEPTLRLHLRAIRAYIGVPKNATKAGVLSEVNWLLPGFRTKIKMVRYYHRLVKMEDTRLTKLVYLWDKSLAVQSWTSEVKSVFEDSNQSTIFESGHLFPIKATVKNLEEYFLKIQQASLELQCLNMSKLRTFLTFKNFLSVPSYLTKPLTFVQRRIMAKIRLGSLALRIETGRYSRPRLLENERTCQVCRLDTDQIELIGEVESEIHFIFNCNRYSDIRLIWLNRLSLPVDFNFLNVYQKLDLVLNHPENVKATAQFLLNAYDAISKILSNI